MWVFLQKFVWFYLMIIWYFTSKNWWNKAILCPIGMLLYQIIILLNDEIKFKDEEFDEIIIIPIIISVCLLLLIIRKKLAFYVDAISLKERLEEEINQIEQELDA
ncbi:hypothetical protein [Flavobacterium psychrophilum]|uniref:hypothetical protein n=1 Tax=Flavobacterium psychrophilum TaxID=96345 RepID=UPI0010693E54|nr:hypothetical protein [Flavobacterium psychrophilum]